MFSILIYYLCYETWTYVWLWPLHYFLLPLYLFVCWFIYLFLALYFFVAALYFFAVLIFLSSHYFYLSALLFTVTALFCCLNFIFFLPLCKEKNTQKIKKQWQKIWNGLWVWLLWVSVENELYFLTQINKNVWYLFY